MMRKNNTVTINNRGMTMVEVLMGFVIMILLLGMFSGIIAASTNMYYNSVDLRRAEESLQRAVYAESVTDALTPEGVVIKLVPVSGMPGDSVPIPLSSNLYKLSSNAVLEGLEEDSLDVDLYFFKSTTAVGE